MPRDLANTTLNLRIRTDTGGKHLCSEKGV